MTTLSENRVALLGLLTLPDRREVADGIHQERKGRALPGTRPREV